MTVDKALTPQMREDFYHFEGNAQALRLVTKLHFLVDENGMNLTYALLNTIVKYPVPSTGINEKSGDIKDKKMGYYFADEEIFEEIAAETGTNGRRHPLTFILRQRTILHIRRRISRTHLSKDSSVTINCWKS